jgi:integrase
LANGSTFLATGQLPSQSHQLGLQLPDRPRTRTDPRRRFFVTTERRIFTRRRDRSAKRTGHTKIRRDAPQPHIAEWVIQIARAVRVDAQKRHGGRYGWFNKAVEASGLPRTTPHDLRHTAASLAVSAGANVKAIQKMLGHASAAMTLDIYADLFDDDLEAVAVALDHARLRESVGKMWARGAHEGLQQT